MLTYGYTTDLHVPIREKENNVRGVKRAEVRNERREKMHRQDKLEPSAGPKDATRLKGSTVA